MQSRTEADTDTEAHQHPMLIYRTMHACMHACTQSHLADHIVHEIGFHGGLQRFQGAAHQIRQRSLEIHCAAVEPSSGELQGGPTGAGGAVFAGLAAARSALGNTAATATAFDAANATAFDAANAAAERRIACCSGFFAGVQSGVHLADRRDK